MTRRNRCILLLTILVAWCLLFSLPSAAQGKSNPSSKSLLKVLTEGAGSLEKDIGADKAGAVGLQQQVKQAEQDVQNLGAQIATLKASQAAQELQVKQAQEALDAFSQRDSQLAAQIKDLQDKREQLSKQFASRTTAFDDLKHEVQRLKATKSPLWKSREIRQAWEHYQQLAKQYKEQATQTLERFDEVLRLLEQGSQSLSTVINELKTHLEASRKEELLKRQTAGSLWGTVKQTVKSLWGMPGRLAQVLADPLLPQKVRTTLRTNWSPLLGLLVVFLLVAWSSLHLRRWALPKLQLWQTEATEFGARIIFKTGEIITSHLFALSFVGWLALTVWVVGWWETSKVRILVPGLLVWVCLRMGLKLIQAVLAGKADGGILPLDDKTARFYRRHLKLLLTYILVLGLFGLNLLDSLGLEPASVQILGQAFGVGLLVWVLFLLRSRYFDFLRAELPCPAWIRGRGFLFTVRALLIAVLGAIIIAGLLGFQNLSAYIAQAATLTGVVLVLFWVTWLGAKAFLEHALRPVRPEKSRVPKEARRQEERLRSYYLSILKVVVILVVAIVFFQVLHGWGVDLSFLSWISRGLTWGTKVGPFNLTLLTVVLAALTLYLGRWFSRFLQVLLEVRFYRRASWDESLRYTISNTVHYAVQALAILMALGFLGISFSDLAIVAGGLGVGIGFGLQNIVNNFLSGLILLFERPIKVGDMLVIDGQWGLVKEIRVRSTIFQTFDRYVLIIPNSDLVTNKVLNWTHYGPGINRLTLKVGVSYGSDVHQVTRIIDEVCRANPRVVPDPPPQIFFEAYGDSSLNFNIWVHLQTPSDRIPATHELNAAIFDAFGTMGIEIPFPQRDLHVKNWPDLSASSPPAPKSEA